MTIRYPSMAPGAIIGYRKNGIPVRFIAGGSETPPEPTPPAPTAAKDPAAPPTPGPPAPTPPPAAPQPAPGQEPTAPQPGGEELPPWAQKQIKALRDEAAANRVKAKEAADAVEKLRLDQEAQRLAMGRAMGLVADEPPTAEALAKQLADSQAAASAAADRARQSAVELAVLRASATLGADGNALLDSRSFAQSVAGLDPSAADFGDKVAQAIGTTIEAQPKYKLTPPAPAAPAAPAPPAVPRSGTGPVTGVPDGPRQWTQADVDRASPSEVQKAMDDGLLQGLGFGTARKRRR